MESRDLVAKLAAAGAEFAAASGEDLAYLRRLGYPESVVRFYAASEPQHVIDINGVRLYPIDDIECENEDAIPGYVAVPFGYLNIASTLYGDTYCVNISARTQEGEAPVVLVSHDLWMEGGDPEEMQLTGVAPIADSFADFLARLERKDLPVDFWDVAPPDEGDQS